MYTRDYNFSSTTVAAFQGVDSISWAGIRGYMSNLVAREDQGMNTVSFSCIVNYCQCLLI